MSPLRLKSTAKPRPEFIQLVDQFADGQGDVKTPFILRVMYFNGGEFIEEDVYASMWRNIMAANGCKDAKNYKDILVKQVTPQGFSKAEGLARDCVKRD